MIKLAVRNVIKNIRKLLPLLIVLTSAFTLLYFSNAILDKMDKILSSVYINLVAGDFTISSAENKNFTMFGSETLLVGEFITAKKITDKAIIEQFELENRGRLKITGLTSAITKAENGPFNSPTVFFGVEWDSYLNVFPDLEVFYGDFPVLENEVIIEESAARLLFRNSVFGDDFSELLGKSITLSTAFDNSFAIRDVIISGIYKYDSSDPLLDKLIIGSNSIANELSGYVEFADSESVKPEDIIDLEAIFSVENDGTVDDGINLASLEDLFHSENENTHDVEAEYFFNNYIVKVINGDSATDTIGRVITDLEKDGFRIKNWRDSVGGNAIIVFYLKLFANLGIGIVIFGILIITINSIVLSLLERTKEIGTMRAIGAQKNHIIRMVCYEVALIIFTCIIISILAGSIFIIMLNTAGITIDNLYTNMLFGGTAITANISAEIIMFQFFLGLLIFIVAVVYPLKKVLSMTPVKAMR